MWFRGVAASMGLCFDFGAVLEGHLDVLFAVDGDVVHHRQPVCFPELRQRLPAPQLFQVGFDLVPSARALYPDCSLADLYDEVAMPSELRRAHQQNDRAVMQAYGFDVKTMTESSCVAELMRRYQALVKK